MNEEITERLLKLETALQLNQEHLSALRSVIWGLLEELHRKKVLPLPEVIAALRSSEAFAQAAFAQPKRVLLEAEIQALQSIADALLASGQ